GMTAVAVVIAAYRAAPFIDAALASVAGQTRMPEEVVVVDDGSDDGTFEIASTWSAVLPLTVIRLTTNSGPAAARAAAIANCRSPLIALLDADDVWLPNHLAAMVD